MVRKTEKPNGNVDDNHETHTAADGEDESFDGPQLFASVVEDSDNSDSYSDDSELRGQDEDDDSADVDTEENESDSDDGNTDSQGDSGKPKKETDEDDSEDAPAKDDSETSKTGKDNADGDNGDVDVDKLQQNLKSQTGRVSGLTKKLMAERKRAEELEQLVQALQSKNDSSTTDGVLSDDELRELEIDYPEAAKLAKAYIGRAFKDLSGAQSDKLSKLVETLAEGSRESVAASEAEILASRHPDYEEIANSEEFAKWVNEQAPPQIRQIALTSDRADDASFVLDLYKKAMNPGASNEGTRQDDLAANESSNKGSESRNRQRDLSQHAELPRKGARHPAEEIEDPIKLFSAIADKP